MTKFDRFARDVADAHAILTNLAARGVRFGLGGSVCDWNDPFDRLFLQTLAMVAEYRPEGGLARDGGADRCGGLARGTTIE